MELENIDLIDVLIFILMITIFLLFGQSVGWRFVGVIQLLFSIKILKERKIAVGIEGFKPSFYLTGIKAVILGFVSVLIAGMLLFFPEQTIMKLTSN